MLYTLSIDNIRSDRCKEQMEWTRSFPNRSIPRFTKLPSCFPSDCVLALDDSSRVMSHCLSAFHSLKLVNYLHVHADKQNSWNISTYRRTSKARGLSQRTDGQAKLVDYLHVQQSSLIIPTYRRTNKAH